MFGANDGNGRLGSNQLGSLERSRYPNSTISRENLRMKVGANQQLHPDDPRQSC